MPRLYARRPLLRELLPRLIGLASDRQVRLGPEHREDLPAVLLTGGHGAGKTAILDALEEAYTGRTPLARHPFVRVDAWAREHDRLTNTSPVVEMLAEAAVSLAPGGAEYGTVAFPRLLPGLVAVSCWLQGEEPQRDLAHRRLDRLLAACAPAQGGTPLNYGIGEELARANSEVGAEVSPVDELLVIAEALVERYFRAYAPGKDGRRVREWYRDRDRRAEEGLDALVRLCPAFHRAGEYRRAAERVLVAAFLADLTDSFGWWKRRNRTPRPLLLLDDVHAEGGDHALRLLLESRTPSRGGAPDPLVIVATRLGEADTRRYPDATRRRLPEVVGASGWARADDTSPSAGLLELPLPPLNVEDQLAMLESTNRFWQADLPSALDRLTAGSPVACRAFCDAIELAAEAGHEVGPDELLELTDADGRRVTEAVLERLVPAPAVRRRLMLQCTAWDVEAADALADERSTGVEPLSAAAARTYLASEGWASGDGPHFVTDRLLREVLTQELRHADAAELGVDWAELHARYRAHHRARGDAGEPQLLRHTLAAGDDRAVVSRLVACFPDWEAPRWLDCLRQVVSAPRPPRAGWRDERRRAARGDLDRSLPDGGPLELCVHRLVHGLWYLSETTVEPAEQMCTDVGDELGFLSLHHPSGRAVLNLAAREWPHAAWHKAPLPVMGLG
jgi:hypothetical protein